MKSHFRPSFFAFLRELHQNNNRDWFADNRRRFVDDVEAPMLAFINDFAPALRSISPAYVVDRRRIGGSMYRIYRDTRFSEDKTPFRTWVAGRFEHEARRKVESVPGFYVRLGIDRCIAGGGIYHVDRPGLTRIRQRIIDAPDEWRRARSGLEIQGEQLKRGPAGFPTRHEHIEDLKRQQLYALTELSETEVVADGFLDRFTDICVRLSPLMEFHTKALGLRWK